MKKSVTALSFCLLLLWTLFQGSALSGTVDSATLTPAASNVLTGAFQQIHFSALNDKSFSLKSYTATLQYGAGLTISDLSTSPSAATATIDMRKRLIKLSWNSVPAGTELST